MPESAGDFRKPEEKRHDCPHCKAHESVTVTVWESSCGGYEDEKHHCDRCGATWWIDGPDS